MAFLATRGSESRSLQNLIQPLSLELKVETAELHRSTEQKLGLPHAITNLAEYGGYLDRFYRIYRPLEVELARFVEWPLFGIELQERQQADRLTHDLVALGIAPEQLVAAPKVCLPVLPAFPYALGAMYVMEGSTLGSQFILRHLGQLLGQEIAAADCFFRGHGEQTQDRWREFRASLDLYGAENRGNIPQVVLGAKRTFQAIADWMQP